MANLVLNDCGVDVNINQITLEQKVQDYSLKYQDDTSKSGSTHHFPGIHPVGNLYRMAAILKSRMEELSSSPNFGQTDQIKTVSSDYLLTDNSLLESELQHLSDKYSRFVSPLSGGLVATLIWKKVVERVTHGEIKPVVLGASVDSEDHRAYIQSDGSITSDDIIRHVYLVDDVVHTGKTRDILLQTAKRGYLNAKIYPSVKYPLL